MKHYVNDNWKCYGFLIRNYGGQKIVEHIENGKRKEVLVIIIPEQKGNWDIWLFHVGNGPTLVCSLL